MSRSLALAALLATLVFAADAGADSDDPVIYELVTSSRFSGPTKEVTHLSIAASGSFTLTSPYFPKPYVGQLTPQERHGFDLAFPDALSSEVPSVPAGEKPDVFMQLTATRGDKTVTKTTSTMLAAMLSASPQDKARRWAALTPLLHRLSELDERVYKELRPDLSPPSKSKGIDAALGD